MQHSFYDFIARETRSAMMLVCMLRLFVTTSTIPFTTWNDRLHHNTIDDHIEPHHHGLPHVSHFH